MAKLGECDRCGKQQAVTTANVGLPDYWKTVEDTDLCPNCLEAFKEFLRPLPKQAVRDV